MLDHLNEYFDKFIKQYHPYQDKEFYQILIKFLQENYLADSYDEIPNEFKILYEEHTLIPEVYDVILQSIGYGKRLLNELTFNQKKILLYNFTDYYADKGNLHSFKRICSIFNESINLFELYIDYRSSTNLYDWYFIPKPISLSDEYDSTNSYNPIAYDEVYNKTPTYFVNKATLINNYVNKELKLPLKSNLILMEVTNLTKSDEVTNLILVTVLHHFKDVEIELTIDDNTYIADLLSVYQLWSYILFTFHGRIDYFDTSEAIVIYDLTTDTFPYTLTAGHPNDLASIITEYETLESASDINTFYETKFKDVFLDYIHPHLITLDTIKRNLSFNIDLRLMTKIDLILENPLQSDVSKLLGDIRTSLIMFMNDSTDELFNEYSPVLLNQFELSLMNPIDTATYKLMDYFKPYHTRLISRYRHGIEYKSKFNHTLLDEHVMFITHQFEASSVVISVDVWFSERIEGIVIGENSSSIIVAEEVANAFDDPWEDQIYWEGVDFRHSTMDATRVIGKYWTDETIYDSFGEVVFDGYWTLQLEEDYPGLAGVFTHCYKRYHEIKYEPI